MKKVILHLCADIGSDSKYYQQSEVYEVIKIGMDIGVENYAADREIHGIIANPVCSEFSTAKCFSHKGDLDKGMEMVNHCLRIIEDAKPVWWVMENPANGRLKEKIGKYKAKYQPWEYGSPWTKLTALWGNFNMPDPTFKEWEKVPKIKELYIRPGRKKPGLVYLHKSAVDLIPEFQWAKDKIKKDSDIRSMCSDGFAREFFLINP